MADKSKYARNKATYRVVDKKQYARAKASLNSDSPVALSRKRITRRTAVNKIRERRTVRDTERLAVQRKRAVSKIRAGNRSRIASGIGSVAKSSQKFVGGGSSAGYDNAEVIDAGVNSLSSAPSRAYESYRTAQNVGDFAYRRVVESNRKRVIKKNYIDNAVERNRAARKEASKAAKKDIKSIRKASNEEVKRYRAAQKAKKTAEGWRREAARQRAIANASRRKAQEAGSIFKSLKYGKTAASAAAKSKVAEIIGAIAAALAPFLAVLLVIIALILAFIVFFSIFLLGIPGYTGWYADDIAPTSNLYDAITEMTNLYNRDIRTYCHYNNVPLPDDCSPEWGRTLALWSVLCQHYFGASGMSNSGGSSNIPIWTYTGTGSMNVCNYSGVLDVADVDTVTGDVYLQPGEYELLYFCFRVIHYDMIKVEELEENGFEPTYADHWGVPSHGAMFARGLPLMRTEEMDPITTTIEAFDHQYNTPEGYCGGDTSLLNPDCPTCAIALDTSRPDSDMVYHNGTHEHRVSLGMRTYTSRHIVTTTQARTAQEALAIIHRASLGLDIEVNGGSYPPSSAVKRYCEQIMVKNFKTSGLFSYPELLTGAGFALNSYGSPNGGCGQDGCVRTTFGGIYNNHCGCLYNQYLYMLNTFWSQSNMGWYQRVDGDWSWSSSKPDNIYVVGVMPELTSSYGPLWITTHQSGDAVQMMINQICNAVYAASVGGAVREVWVEHLRYLAANCCVFDSDGSINNQTWYNYMQSTGCDPNDYYDRNQMLYITPDTFFDGRIGSAAYTSYSSTGYSSYGRGVQDAMDWLGTDTYYVPIAFSSAIFQNGTGQNAGIVGYNWIAPGYQAPSSSAGQSIIGYPPNAAWCAWFVCYAANTNGLYQSCITGMPYFSYYNLLAHQPNEIDTGEGYFCNDEAVSATCQYMLRGFHNHAGDGGEVTCIIAGDGQPVTGIAAGDIIFFRGSGSDHRTSEERSGDSYMPITNHVGIVLGVTDSQIITIEGNTTGTVDRVGIGCYSYDSDYIVAYVDPFSTQFFEAGT